MKIIVANWKMNGNISLVKQFVKELSELRCNNKIIICPPAALVAPMALMLSPPAERHADCTCKVTDESIEVNASPIRIGAQDCFYEEFGAFTGEHSPKLLNELGCDYVLLGHSERRTLFHESDEIIHRKWNAAIKQSLCPIVCVGEKLEERDNWKEVISKQLKNQRNVESANRSVAKPTIPEDFLGDTETLVSLRRTAVYSDVHEDPSTGSTTKIPDRGRLRNRSNDETRMPQTIFAYEPIGSIGTGLVPSIGEIENVLDFIRHELPVSQNAIVLYGGSVTSKNARAILSSDSVDGVLVGGASLRIDEFMAIATAV